MANQDKMNEILDVLKESVVGGMAMAQLDKSMTIGDIMKVAAPSFEKFKKKDIIETFIGFALNLTVQQQNAELAREAANAAVVATEEALVESGVPAMAKGGEA